MGLKSAVNIKCSNLCIAFIDSINFRYSYPVPCSFITWLNLIKQARSHPRRPRGGQSGREKRFQIQAKEPLGTDSHRTISKNSSGCRLQIGHKKCFVLLCPIGEQFLLSFFREFVHDGYCLGTLARPFTKLVRARETFIFYFPNKKRRNYR